MQHIHALPDATKPVACRTATSILLIAVLLSTLAVVVPCYRLAIFPYQIDYGEGLMLEGAQSLREGRLLYPPAAIASGFPVIIHVYGPLAYASVAAIMRTNHPSYTPGRVLILFCALATSAVIAAVLRRHTGTWKIGLSFGLILLTLPAARFWIYLLRADLIGIAISLAGLSLYVSSPRHKYWTVLFFTAALFCKYTLLAAPAAVFFHLLFNRERRAAFRFAALLMSFTTAAFSAVQVKTHGGFAFHMFSTHPDPYSLAQVGALTALVWLSAPVVTALAIAHVIRALRSRNLDIASLYFLAATLTSLTAGKLGSTTNHLLEWMVGSCLCAGLGYASLLSQRSRREPLITTALIVSMILGVFFQNRASQQPYSELAECSGIYNSVAAARSSRVLSQSLGPLLLTRTSVLLTDPFVYGQLVEHKTWPGEPLRQLINDRYFDIILATTDPANMQAADSNVWPKSLLAAMARHYQVSKKFQCRDSSFVLERRP